MRPYFLWDYDLSEEEVCRMIKSGNETSRVWIISRILESAKYEDVWRYVDLAEVKRMFPRLKLKEPIRKAWAHALAVWSDKDDITEGGIRAGLKVDVVKDISVHFGEISRKDKVRLDAVENIGSNKIAAIFGRTDGKDFVDLYMILKRTKLTFDYLYNQAKRKDLGLSEFYLAEALAAVNKVELFPKVTPPIDERELKAFYAGLSHKLLMKIKPEE